jgi:hypothetical protein
MNKAILIVDDDIDSLKPKWDDKKNLFFNELVKTFELTNFWDKESIEKEFKEIAAVNSIKTGDLMLPLRGALGFGTSFEYFDRRTYFQDAARTESGASVRTTRLRVSR